MPSKRSATPKIALVCDWLTNVGGAERVLLSLHEMFPDAPIYTSQYNKKGIDWFNDADVRTGWMQILPSRLRRLFGPLRQLYFNHLDLSEYNVIISVTGAEAKSIKFDPNTSVHLCYCHVPTQYYWQMYDEYIANPGFGILNPIARIALKLLLKPLKTADCKAAQRPTEFITISNYARELIKKYYKREARIVNPPVAVENFSTRELQKTQNYYITTARQVTWKRLDLCIQACQSLNKELYLIGEGPEHAHLVKLANSSPLIHFIPQLTQKELIPYLQKAKAYLFPSLEPFGIAPVEALAAGCPVIAYHQGGSRDFVTEGKNGTFFDRQTPASLAKAIQHFETLKLNQHSVATSAIAFNDARFKQQIQEIIDAHRH